MAYVSRRTINYDYYEASTNALFTDTTEYSQGTTDALKLTITLKKDFAPNTKLGFYADMKATGGAGIARCRFYLNGVQIIYLTESGGTYVTHSGTYTSTYLSAGDVITVYGGCSVAGLGWAKNIKICGDSKLFAKV